MTAKRPAVRPENRCSFCRKTRGEAGPLVEGPGLSGTGGVFICRLCAVLCQEIADEEQRRADEGTRDRAEAGQPRGKTIAALIRELRKFEDQTLEVRLSLDLGQTTHAISLVGTMNGQCLLLHCKDERNEGG
jgi:hypothetical protein